MQTEYFVVFVEYHSIEDDVEPEIFCHSTYELRSMP